MTKPVTIVCALLTAACVNVSVVHAQGGFEWPDSTEIVLGAVC